MRKNCCEKLLSLSVFKKKKKKKQNKKRTWKTFEKIQETIYTNFGNIILMGILKIFLGNFWEDLQEILKKQRKRIFKNFWKDCKIIRVFFKIMYKFFPIFFKCFRNSFHEFLRFL